MKSKFVAAKFGCFLLLFADLAGRAVAAQADLSVTKTANAINVPQGTLVTFSIVVSNAGPDSVADVKVPDQLGPGWTFGSVFSSGNAVFESTSNTWNIFVLSSGSSETLSLQAYASAVGTLTNAASVLPVPGFPDPDTNNNLSFVSVSVTATNNTADLLITKTSNVTNVLAGTLVTFSIVVSNAGPASVSDVKVPELLGPGWTFGQAFSSGNAVFESSSNTWNIFGLLSGTSETLTLQAYATDAGALTNTAKVLPVAGFPDPNTNNNVAFATVFVTATNNAADLLITKTSNATNVLAGTLVTFSIVVSNAGPANVSDVKVPELLGPGWTFGSAFSSGNAVFESSSNTWNIFGLLSGTSETLTLQAYATDAGALTNTAMVLPAAGFPDPNTNNNVAFATVFVTATNNAADLFITKTSNATNVLAGTLITFSIVVSNAGPASVSDVKVPELLGPGWTFGSAFSSGNAVFESSSNTWNIFGLLSGTSETLTLQAYATDAGALTNTAKVLPVAGFPDPNTNNNVAFATVFVTATNNAADLLITKTSNVTNVLAGTLVTFSIVVSNAGPANVSDVKVPELLGPGWTFGSAFSSGNAVFESSSNTWNIFGLLSGTSETLTLQAYAINPGVLTNTALVLPVPGFPDPNTNNNASFVSVSVTATNAAADLIVTKTANMTNATLGTLVTFSIVVSNAGPSQVSDVKVNELLGPGWVFDGAYSSGNATFITASNTWNIYGLPAGGAETLTLQAVASSYGTLTNSAIVLPSPDFPDPNLNNNSSSAFVTVPSTNFTVVLRIETDVAHTLFTVLWPDSTPADWILETSGELPGTTWNVVTNAPSTSGSEKFVTFPISAGGEYFRLRKH